jgi:hypothetical protein
VDFARSWSILVRLIIPQQQRKTKQARVDVDPCDPRLAGSLQLWGEAGNRYRQVAIIIAKRASAARRIRVTASPHYCPSLNSIIHEVHKKTSKRLTGCVDSLKGDLIVQ